MKLPTIFQYISEAMPSPPKNVDPDAFNTFTKEVDLELAADLITERCSDSIDSTPLFRGMGTRVRVPYFAADSSQIPRQSKDNANYYTELLSTGLTSWKRWPRRDRATICTNDADAASAYGTIYRVYPENGTILAIAPAEDIWVSFSQLIKVVSPDDDFRLDELMVEIMEVGGMHGAKSFAEALQLPAKTVFPAASVALHGTVKSVLEQYMTPELNGFKRGAVGHIEIPSEPAEIWFSGYAVFVRESDLDALESLL